MSVFESVERWLYPTPPLPPQLRTRPLEVLALGHSRSGTESLREALRVLGYDPVYHGFEVPESEPQTFEAWTRLARRKFGTSRKARDDDKGFAKLSAEDFDEIIAPYTAVTDQQGAMFGQELIKAFPKAKVILNYRDPETWYTSISNTFGIHMTGFRHRVLPYFSSRLYWRRRYYVELLDAYFHGSLSANGRWVYEEHCAKIVGLMQNRPEHFLKWSVEDGWQPLCTFLERPIPERPFPSGNLPADTLCRIRSYLEADERKAKFKLACVGGLTLTTIIVLGVHYLRLYR